MLVPWQQLETREGRLKGHVISVPGRANDSSRCLKKAQYAFQTLHVLLIFIWFFDGISLCSPGCPQPQPWQSCLSLLNTRVTGVLPYPARYSAHT